MSKSWDNSILKKLKTLVGKGLSTSEIGKRLGLSKNAVVGKLHRLGWNAKASDAEVVKPKVADKKPVAAKKTAPRAAAKVEKKAVHVKKSGGAAVKKSAMAKPAKETKSAEKPKEPAPKKTGGHAIAGKGVAVHQRMVQHALEMANLKPNQCRWPIGDPDSEGFHFCGHPVFVGKPYCYEHCKQAYQFAPPKKK